MRDAAPTQAAPDAGAAQVRDAAIDAASSVDAGVLGASRCDGAGVALCDDFEDAQPTRRAGKRSPVTAGNRRL